MRKLRRWGLLLCLLLLAGCGTPRARRAGYAEIAAWLEAHALPGETVAVQERAAWARLTAQPLVTLLPDGDAATLLASLAETRPDYCIALRSVVWDGVQAAPWFREHYRQVASTAAVDDPASPLTLYRYYPSPFDGPETLHLNQTLHDGTVGHITLETVHISSRRLAPGEPVYVSLTLSGNVSEPLHVVWQLRDPVSGRVWLRDVRLETGGLPTDSWPVQGTVTERYVVTPPEALPPGETTLELTFTRLNLAPFGGAQGEAVLLATFFRPPDVTRTPPAPDHPLEIAVGDTIALVGYDAPQRRAPGETLRVALYWRAQHPISADWMVFVHLLGADGMPAAQIDAFPVYWTYPTTAWQLGDYIRDVHIIPLDESLPRGDYRVSVGMYDPATGERLRLRDAAGTPLPDNAAQLYVLRVR